MLGLGVTTQTSIHYKNDGQKIDRAFIFDSESSFFDTIERYVVILSWPWTPTQEEAISP